MKADALRGHLDILVLAALRDEPLHGYAVIEALRRRSAGEFDLAEGTLYPVLHRLERLGHVEARWEVAPTGRRRKYYGITSRGREQLAEERRQWQAVDETLRGIWRALSLPDPGSAPLPAGA